MPNRNRSQLIRKDRIDKMVSRAYLGHNDQDSDDLVLVCEDHELADSHALTLLFTDIADQVGMDFLEQIPADLLERFCMMTVTRNDGTGLLLRHLLLGFMQAYANPATSEMAVEALLDIEDLGGVPKAVMN
jgi:hypothetical protein